MPKCGAVNARGAPCGAWAVHGSTLCFTHGQREAAREAAVKGGQSRAAPKVLPGVGCVKLRRVGDVLREIERLYAATLSGAVETRISNAASILLGHAARLLVGLAMERRVVELEKMASDNKRVTGQNRTA